MSNIPYREPEEAKGLICPKMSDSLNIVNCHAEGCAWWEPVGQIFEQTELGTSGKLTASDKGRCGL
jgi:hypothetical protein